MQNGKFTHNHGHSGHAHHHHVEALELFLKSLPLGIIACSFPCIDLNYHSSLFFHILSDIVVAISFIYY